VTDKNRYVDVVAKLTRLTQEKKLKWETRTGHSALAEEYTPFYASYRGRHLRVAKHKPKTNPFLINTFITTGVEEYVALDLVNERGDLIWTFPNVAGLQDLYEAVQYQIAGVDTLIQDFLKEDD